MRESQEPWPRSGRIGIDPTAKSQGDRHASASDGSWSFVPSDRRPTRSARSLKTGVAEEEADAAEQIRSLENQIAALKKKSKDQSSAEKKSPRGAMRLRRTDTRPMRLPSTSEATVS